MSTSHDIDLHWAGRRAHFSACDEYLIWSVVSEHINSVIRLAFVRSLLYSLEWHVIIAQFISIIHRNASTRSIWRILTGHRWFPQYCFGRWSKRMWTEIIWTEVKSKELFRGRKKRSWNNGAFRNNSNLADRLLRNGEIVSTRCWSCRLYRTSSGNCVCKFFSFLEFRFHFRVGMRNMQAITNRRINKIDDD